MRTIVAESEWPALLNRWAGAYSSLWMYHVSLQRLAICLAKRDTHDALFTIAAGCYFISGPTSWQNADIAITHGQESDGSDFMKIFDTKAGFEVRCKGVAVAIGSEGVPANPFAGFFDTGPDE